MLMEIPDYSLLQITPEVLVKLNPNELLKLSVKLLKDLKELHDRLNQNSNNSSRPSSSIHPWENTITKTKARDKNTTIENVLHPTISFLSFLSNITCLLGNQFFWL